MYNMMQGSALIYCPDCYEKEEKGDGTKSMAGLLQPTQQ